MNLFRAHGKLLISAEYMVLHGSSALALPLKMGQTLQLAEPEDSGRLSWRAFWQNDLWFSADFHPATLALTETTDPQKATYLRKLLRVCLNLAPSFQKELNMWDVETRLEFSPQWGLGSSSTLTALLARWAGIDPLDLHFRISSGSGYDVACATANGPILYQLVAERPRSTPVDFNPPFASRLYFVWLGNKQPTDSHLRAMTPKLDPGMEDIQRFSSLSRSMLEATSLSDFRTLMEEHEARLAELTGLEPVSALRFPGLQGSVKSLGAWGGDFVMIASEQDPDQLYNYLDKLGYTTRFRYKELVHGS